MGNVMGKFLLGSIGQLAKLRGGVMVALAVISSFAITFAVFSSSASAAVCPSSPAQFCWFSDANYSGSIRGGWTGPSPYQCVAMGGSANDVLSSAANWTSYKAILYMDANCSGFGYMIQPWSAVANLSGTGFNDETSSYIFVQ